MDDSTWLAEFVEHRSQEAFARVVSRHVDLVYSAALRQVKDRHVAEDVTQAVFVALAKKAHTLRKEVALSAWLLVTTRYVALDTLKAQSRRRRHERKAAEMTQTTEQPPEPGQWDDLAPHLDAALASLNTADRRAITLRYFEGKSFDEVAQLTGVSLEAARQRVHRATARMRAFFSSHGVNVSASAIGPWILAHAVHAAPAGLAAASAAAAATAAKTASVGLLGGIKGVVGSAKGSVLVMASTQVKLLAGAAALLVVSGGAVVGYKVMSPPPPPAVVITPQQQVTNLADAEWKKRFTSVYELAPGQIVKLVSPPMIPERQRMWNDAQNGHGFPLTPDSSFTFKANGPDIHWSSLSLAPNTLSMALQMGARLKGWEIDSSIPLGMPFPGDWVFRDKATPQEVMDSLAGLVSQRLGRQVRFVKRTVMREAIIARGEYKFVPLPGYPNDKTIQLIDGKPMQGDPPPFTRDEKLADLFDWVSIFQTRKVIDETGSGKMKIKVRDHQVYRDTDTAVRNITAQTSIRFDREPREMDVWFMVDSNGTTLPATQP